MSSVRPRDSLRGSNATPAADAPELIPARGRARTTDQKHGASTFRIGHEQPVASNVENVQQKSRVSHIPRDNLGPLGAEHQPTQQKTRSLYTPRDHLGPSATSTSPSTHHTGRGHTSAGRNQTDHITDALNHGNINTPIKRERKVVKETVAPNKAPVPNVDQENQTPRDSARKRYHHSTISLASNYEKPLPLPDTSHRVLKNVSSLASDNGQLVTAAPVRAAGKSRAATQSGGEGLNLFAAEKANTHNVNKPFAGRTNSSSIFTADTPSEVLRPSKSQVNINNRETSMEQCHRPARAGVRAVNSGAASSNIISWQ